MVCPIVIRQSSFVIAHIMKLSLAGWSLQKFFRAIENPLKMLDYPRFVREQFGIEAVELNNTFFESTRPEYLDKLRTAAFDAGVTMLNLAIDEHGDLSDGDPTRRAIAIANYARWIPVAAYLGMPTIRANSGGADVNMNDMAALSGATDCCIDSFRRLCDVGIRHGVQITIENHWGLSFNPDFIVLLAQCVERTHGKGPLGVLADFGNWPDTLDRYQALEKIMPYASATHAKVNDIDEHLNHPRFDHKRCIDIAKRAGYDGYLGIEYESDQVDPIEGIRRGIRLLTPML